MIKWQISPPILLRLKFTLSQCGFYKNEKMSPLIYIMIFAASTLSAFCQNSTNWSDRIVSKQRMSLVQFLKPCGETINELIIDGKCYEHVRGIARFYLQIPHENNIVFVTNEKSYTVHYHVFNMDNDTDIVIVSTDSVFGDGIGSNRLEDSVKREQGGLLVLEHVDNDAKSTLSSLINLDKVKTCYYIDVDKRTVLLEKTIYFSKSGNVIREIDVTP